MKFTNEKSLIRQIWAKPLLKFLTKQLGQKLVYLGLPSPEAEDILERIEFIRIIIAFQCDDDRYPDAYKIMAEKLAELERQNKIETYQAYRGYIEEVVLMGRDRNIGANSQFFNLKDIVTLYNLDFCNNVDSPLEIFDEEGNVHTVYKFDAIKNLIRIQENLSNISSKFILFLTVHCSYKGTELANYLDNCNHQEYVKNVRTSLNSHNKNARIVRLFVIDAIQHYFRSSNFIPKFLPTIFYRGIGNTYLLNFTVLGTRVNSAGLAPWLQDLTDLINTKFVTVEENTFQFLSLEKFDEKEIEKFDPISFVANSPTFQKYWIAK